MRIFDREKINELNKDNLNFEMGHLEQDRLFVKHHEAVEEQAEQWHYETIAEYPNGGKDIKKIIDKPATEQGDAYDEYENILIYIPYTDEEIEERNKENLRRRREPLLTAFDKWEKAVLRGREAEDETVMQWYRDLLDLKKSAFDTVPERVKYYL